MREPEDYCIMVSSILGCKIESYLTRLEDDAEQYRYGVPVGASEGFNENESQFGLTKMNHSRGWNQKSSYSLPSSQKIKMGLN